MEQTSFFLFFVVAMKTIDRRFWVIGILLLARMALFGQTFVNDGEKVVYHVSRDTTMVQGTVSDALQNIPGLKVDTEGNITLRGVSQVEIWLNDAPSHFDVESQKNYLQQTSVENIARIEVITNPSARYTTETDLGIINIWTNGKQQHTQHLSVGIQANTSPNVSPWLAYSWSGEKFSFSANAKGNFKGVRSVTDTWSCSFDSIPNPDAEGFDWDTTRYHTNRNHTSSDEISGEIFLKMDYRPNSRNKFMAYLSMTPSVTRERSTDSTYRHEYVSEIGEYNYIVNSDKREDVVFGSAGLFFQHLFARQGEQFTFSLDSDFDRGNTGETNIRNFKEHSSLNRDIYITNFFSEAGWNAKAEYVLPYSKNGELYFSLSNNFKPDNNLMVFDTLNTAFGQRFIDSIRSERRDFGRNISSAMVILQQRWGNFTFKPGLELENAYITARYYRFRPGEGDTSKDFLFFKPSLHLSYRTASMHNFSLSYTRKTTYPYVRYFVDRVVYEEEKMSQGEPLLRPTAVDIFEGGWTKYWEQFGSVGINVYLKDFTDAINDLSELRYDPLYGRAVNFSWPVNIDTYTEAGTTFNVTYRPNALLNVRLDANLYQANMKTLFEGDLVEDRNWAYSFRLGFWSKLWNKLELHATAYYDSPTYTLYASTQTAYGINCGLRADFFADRLSLLLNANDIFNWNKENNYITNPAYQSYTSSKVNSRYVSLEVIFKIL